MSAPATVSVPGKLILMGEHAAVYGCPAVVAAIGLRLRARVRADAFAGGVKVRVQALGLRERWSWAQIRQTTHAARERWERYAAAPSSRTFSGLGGDPGELAKIALGEAVLALQQVRGRHPPVLPGVALRIDSDIPVGAGFGSSAAASTAIIASYVAHQSGQPDWAVVRNAVDQVERRQHGSPSGVDAATVFHGGVTLARRGPEDELICEPVQARPESLRCIRVFDTGRPLETTGSVVAAVRERRDRDAAGFDRLLAEMERLTLVFHERITRPAADGQALIEPIRRYHRMLQQCGVVPRQVDDLVRRIEKEGGAAKISGAGALSGPGAGSLLVVHAHPERIDEWQFLGHLTACPVQLGVEGVRVEAVG